MLIGLTEKQLRADEHSSRQFDYLVKQAVAGNVQTVEVTWEDATDERGEPAPIPHVSIDGETAEAYIRRPMEYVTDDTELIDLTALAFEEKVGSMWEGTKDAIEELNLALVGSATSRDAGYFDKARAELIEQGASQAGDGEIIARARQLATHQVKVWSSAASAQKSSRAEK